MTPYDLAMAGVVVAGMVWGAIRGITWQLASIASLVLGYLVAKPASAELAPHLTFTTEPVVARGVALLIVYAAVSGGVFFLAWLVRATLRAWKFEAFDRHLGMLLGGLEGALVGMIATVIAVSVSPTARHSIMTSPTGGFVGSIFNALQPALPGEVRTVLAKYWVDDPDAPTVVDEPATDPAADGDRKSATATVRGAIDQQEAKVARDVAGAIEDRIGRAIGDNQDGSTPRR